MTVRARAGRQAVFASWRTDGKGAWPQGVSITRSTMPGRLVREAQTLSHDRVANRVHTEHLIDCTTNLGWLVLAGSE
jgi:hypothetical protein